MAGAARHLMRAYWPWAIALLGGVFLALATWPGHYSFDSAYAWWQARTGVYSNLQSLPLTLWIAAFDRLGMSPAWLIAATQVALSLLVLASAHAFGLRAGRALIVWALVALNPLLLVTAPQLWTDVHLALVLLGACALLAIDVPRARFRMGAALLLAYALSVRPNALTAVLPLALFVTADARDWRWPRALLGMAAVLLAGAALASALALKIEERRDAWAVILMWDLQALSVARGAVLLPSNLHGPGLSAAELARSFDPHTAMGLYLNTPSGIANPGVEAFTAERKSALIGAWFSAIRTDPGAYLSHRTRVLIGLLGTHCDGSGRGLIDAPGVTPYQNNPSPGAPLVPLNRPFLVVADALKSSGLIAPGLWLGLGALLFVARGFRRVDRRDALLWAIAASALGYLLPYALIAPSIETRYALWSVLGLLLAGGVRLFRPRSGLTNPGV